MIALAKHYYKFLVLHAASATKPVFSPGFSGEASGYRQPATLKIRLVKGQRNLLVKINGHIAQ